jgi:2-iminobutanoate/2-iminopropanoate deaminase
VRVKRATILISRKQPYVAWSDRASMVRIASRHLTNGQRIVLQNLKEVLELAGSSLEQVVKFNGVYPRQACRSALTVCAVYLADMKDFAGMNEAYIAVSLTTSPSTLSWLISSQFLPQPMPSRSCLQALAPGPGTIIEIECIAQV